MSIADTWALLCNSSSVDQLKKRKANTKAITDKVKKTKGTWTRRNDTVSTSKRRWGKSPSLNIDTPVKKIWHII